MVTLCPTIKCACGTEINALSVSVSKYVGRGKTRHIEHERMCFGCAKRRGLYESKKKPLQPIPSSPVSV